MADHPGPAADRAFIDRAGTGRCEGRVDVIGRHVEAIDVVQETVPRLADDGQRPVRRPEWQLSDSVPDDPVADDADRMRVGDPDRAGEVAGLPDPFEPCELSVAVEAVAAREERLG